MRLPSLGVCVRTAIVGLIVASATTTYGQSVTNWTGTGGGGLWSTNGNWASGSAPTSSIDTNLTFGISPAPLTINMDIGTVFTLNKLTFTSDVNGTGVPAAYTFSGGDLLFSTSSTSVTPEMTFGGANAAATITQTIGNNIQFNSNLMTFRVDGSNSNSIWMAGSVTATGGGAAVITLTGTSTNTRNMFAGAVGEANGTVLSIQKDGAGRWEFTGATSISGGYTHLAGTTVFTGATTIGGPIVQSLGSLSFNGVTTFSNVATISGGTMILTNAAHVYGAGSGFSVEGGTLRISDGGGINLGNAPLTLGSAANATGSLTYSDNIVATMTRGFTMLGTGLMTLASETSGTWNINGAITYGDSNVAKSIVLGGAGVGVNTITSTIDNNGSALVSLQKNGGTTWVVGGTNTFSGNLTITAGHLRVSNTTTNLNLANNNLAFAGTAGTVSVLEAVGSITSALGSGANQIQFVNAANNSGGFAAVGGALNVTLSGDATTSIMWGDATYNANKLAPTTELQLSSTNANDVVTFANPLTLSTGAHTVRVTDNPTSTADWAVMSGTLSGPGGLSKAGTGQLVLTASNSFTGSISIVGGSLKVTSMTTNLNMAGNRLTFNSAAGTVGVLETAGTISVALGTSTGSHRFLLSGGYGASGGNLTVVLNNAAGLTWNAGSFVLNSSELQLNSIYSDSKVTLSNAIALGTAVRTVRVTDNTNANGDYAVILGAISGGAGGALIKEGTGLLELGATSTYNGGTTIRMGTLRGASPTTLNLASQNLVFSVTAGIAAVLETAGTITSNLGNATGSIQFVNISATGGASGGFSAYNGTLNVALNNGADLIWSGGPAGQLFLSNGTSASGAVAAELQFGSILSDNVVTFQNNINLSDAVKTVRVFDNPTTNADYAVMSGVITSTTLASGGLIKQGPGTLVLTGDSLYTGRTSIRGGTLRLGNGGAGGSVAGEIRLAVTTTTAPALIYNHNVIVNQVGLIANSAGNTAGVLITGNAAGGVQFNAANTYNGTTTLDIGTLRLGIANGSSANSPVWLNSTGTIDLNGFSGTIGGLIEGTGGPGKVVNNGAAAATLTISSTTINSMYNGLLADGGVGTGTMAIIKAGAGTTLTLGNDANSYSGGTTITGGSIYVNNYSALGTGPVTFAGGTLLSATTGAYTFATNLAGALTFTGANAYTFDSAGLTNVIGNATLSNETSLGAAGVVFNDDFMLVANLMLAGTQDITINGNLSLTGTDGLTPGVRTLTVNNTGGHTFNAVNLSADGQANVLIMRGLTTLTMGGPITGIGQVSSNSGINVITNSTNSYSGGTSLAGGTLVLPVANAIGTGTFRMSGGTLQNDVAQTLTNAVALGGAVSLSGTQPLTLSPSTGFFSVDATTTLSNVIGPNAVTLNGNIRLMAGNLLLQASNTLNINGNIEVYAATRTLTNNNAGQLINGGVNLAADGAGHQFDIRALQPITFSGSFIDGGFSGAIVRYITGPITLSSAGVYGGESQIFGTVQFSSDNAFGTSTIWGFGGQLEGLGGTKTLANTITLSNTLTFTGANDFVLNGNVSTTGNRAIAIGSPITLTIAGNLVTGEPTVARTLTIASNTSATVRLTGNVQNSATPGGSLIISMTNSGSKIFLSGTNSQTGTTTLSGGAIRYNDWTTQFGSARVVFAAAAGIQNVLETNGSLTLGVGLLNGQVTWSGGGGFAAVGGPLNITFNNDAVTPMVWSAAGSMGGTGEMQLGSVNADNTVTITNTIDIIGGRTIRVFDGSAAVDAVMSGVLLATTTTTGWIVKQGPGTLAFTGANTFSSGVTVAAGTLKVGNGGATGSITGAIVTTTGSRVWFDRSSGNFNQTTITGTGDVDISIGTGVMTVTNLSASGLVTVSTGTVQVGAGRVATLGATNVVLNSGSTMRISSTQNISTSADFSGAGQLLISSTGNATGTAVTYLGTSSLTGTITLTGTSNPTLRIGDGVTSGSGSVSGNMNISTSVGVIAFNRPDDYTYGGAISYTAAAGTAQIRKLTNNTLTMSGVSTYTNATSIAAGTLRVGGALGNTPITVAGGATFEVLSGAGVANTTATVNVLNNGNIIISGTMGAASGTLNASAVLRGIGGSSAGTWNIDGGILEVGGAVSNTISTLHLSGLNIIGAGATLNLDLNAPASSSSSLANLQLSSGDRLTFTNTPTISSATILNLSGNVNTTSGYYLLMSGYAGTINTSLLTVNAPDGFGKQLFSQVGQLFIQLSTVSTLTWDGSLNNGTWDDGATTNFNGGTVAYNNTNRDAVIFDDTAAGTTSVQIVGPLQPSVVNVNNSTLTYTFNGSAISGDGGINKSGSGTLVLLNDNTYTGLTSITGGTVQLGAGGSSGGIAAAGLVTFDTGGTLRVNRNDTYTLGGNISGAGNLEQAGTGTLVLTGNNSYTGLTTVNGGTLSVEGTGVMTDLSPITVNSGTFGINGSTAQIVQSVTVNTGGDVRVNTAALTATTMNVLGGQVNVGASALSVPTFTMQSGTFNVNGAGATTLTTVTLGGSLSDTTGSPTAVFNIADTRILTLTGAVTYSANNNAATDSFGVTITGLGSISTGGAARTWTINDSANTDIEVTITAPITAATSAFTKAGAGKLYLQGTNASTATNTLSAGTLVLGLDGALGTGQLNASGGTLQSDGSPRTLANNIALIGNLTISGTQAMTFNGITTNNGGNRTLTVNDTADVTFNTLRLSEGVTNRILTIAGTGNVIINTLSQNTSTSGQLIVNGTGLTVNLANASVYTGTTSIRNGTLRVGHADSLGAGNTTLIRVGLAATTVAPKLLTTAAVTLARDIDVIGSGAGSEITLGGATAASSIFGGNVALGNSALLTAATSGTVTFAGNLTGAGGITKVGGGLVVLSGTGSTYAGGTTVNQGILAVADATGLGSNAGAILIDPTSAGANPGLLTAGAITLTQNVNILDTNLTNVLLGGGTAVTSTFSGNITFSQGITLFANTSGTVIFTGTLDDGGSTVGTVTKEGNGTVILLGTNAWTGLTTINDGTLSSSNSLAGTVYVNSGGTFTGFGAAGSTIVNQGGSVIYTGNQTGTTEITNGGTVDVQTGSELSGLVSVSDGTLNANNGSTISGTVNVLGGTFNINGGSSITGTLGLSSGAVNVNNGASYTNQTIVNGGSFNVNNGGSVSSTPGIDINSGGTFNVNTGSVTGNGNITVGGSFVANGTVGGGSLGITVENGGTLTGTGNIQGNVTVETGGTLSPGNSVESLGMVNLSLTHGSNLVFEFRDATGLHDFGGGDMGAGFGWDLIDLGASGVLDLGDAAATNQINLDISAFKLDNSGHATSPGDLIFNPQNNYEWLFIKVNSLANLVTNGNGDDFNRRFNIVDDTLNGGVFDTGNNNPFTRPTSSLGEGTFTVAWRNGSQGLGMYIQYSAIPEPGTMLLTGLASLGAGWYGRRRLRRREAEAETVTTA